MDKHRLQVVAVYNQSKTGNKQTVASKNITNYSYGPILAINITFAFGNINFQILFIINNKCDVSPSSLCVKWEWLFVPFSVCHL